MSFLNGKPGPTGVGREFDLKATLAASVFFTGTQNALQAAATVADLHAAATALDSAEFNALPSEAREDLAVLYSHRLLLITGALA